MPETKIDIAVLRGLLEKATPGPWFYRPRAIKHGGAWIADHPDQGKHGKIIVVAGACYSGSDDYDLIAAMRNALPSLLDQLEQSQREVERPATAGVTRPGVFSCPKCELRWYASQFTQEGTVGASRTAECLNGCGPGWGVAWKDECLSAEARAESSEARVAELTAEVERVMQRLGDKMIERAQQHQRADQAEALVARLRGALEPFVAHYVPWMDEHPDEQLVSTFARHTYGQLRTARQALQEGE